MRSSLRYKWTYILHLKRDQIHKVQLLTQYLTVSHKVTGADIIICVLLTQYLYLWVESYRWCLMNVDRGIITITIIIITI